jgi:hypothetical protein
MGIQLHPALQRFTADDIAKLQWMASLGHPATSIAQSLSRTPQAVRVKCVELGIRLRPRRAVGGARFKIPDRLFQALHVEGLARGVKATGLARQLLESIVRDRLYSAVLDVPMKSLPPPRRRRKGADMTAMMSPQLMGDVAVMMLTLTTLPEIQTVAPVTGATIMSGVPKTPETAPAGSAWAGSPPSEGGRVEVDAQVGVPPPTLAASLLGAPELAGAM